MEIKIKPLSIVYEKKLLQYLIIPGNYIFLSDEQDNLVKQKINKYNKEYNLNLTEKIVFSIRSSYMNEKLMFNSPILKLLRSYKYSTI